MDVRLDTTVTEGEVTTYRIGWGRSHRRLAGGMGWAPVSYKPTPDRWGRRWEAEPARPDTVTARLGPRRGWTRAGARRRMANAIRRARSRPVLAA